MSRSTWKLQYINSSFFRNNFKQKLLDISKQNKHSHNDIKVWDRASSINKLFLGKIVQIYNGKVFVFRRIRSKKMIGGKFGELSRCTKRARRKIKGKVSKNLKKDKNKRKVNKQNIKRSIKQYKHQMKHKFHNKQKFK
jgi:ribosomal protein S19